MAYLENNVLDIAHHLGTRWKESHGTRREVANAKLLLRNGIHDASVLDVTIGVRMAQPKTVVMSEENRYTGEMKVWKRCRDES
jgi:hypothetical protein